MVRSSCDTATRIIVKSRTIGTKGLSFKSDRLIFKDSPCFLPFPLTNISSTFCVQELVKGHDYEGSMPLAEMHDPDGISAKMKQNFKGSMQRKVRTNYNFNLKTEVRAFCESNVKLLKARCRKFHEELKRHAELDLIEECINIVSACNRFWWKKTPDSQHHSHWTHVGIEWGFVQPVCESSQVVGLAWTSP